MSADTAAGPGGAGGDGARGDGAGVDGQVQALARVLDRTGRKVSDLETHVRQIAADLARLATLATGRGATSSDTAATPRPGAGSGEHEPGVGDVRPWLLAADPDQAVADLADLIDWLDRVFLRYPDAVLGPCWLWHPHVIEELWWCRGAHLDAYHPDTGSWLRAGDWHDRQRPGVARRVGAALAKCDLTLHAPGRPHGQPAAVAPLAAHAGQVAHYWTHGQGARPEPGPAQLAEAEAWQRAQHRNNR